MTTIVQIGNQTAPHATEAAYRDGYEHAGAYVIGIDQAEAFERGPQFVLDQCDVANADLLVYSRTHNNTALGPEWTDTWRTLEDRGTKTAGVHLDVYWGLPEREDWILRDADPQFTVGTLFTADGGSDDKWKAAGINHLWLPPAADCRFAPENAKSIPELNGKIVFVGSAYGYHPAWDHRRQMIDFATKTWPDRFVIYGNGSPNGAVRGEDLARIYASDCVVIGDGCFADTRARYLSDRAPETLARGGLLCLAATDAGLGDLFVPGEHLYTWTPFEFDHLERLVSNLWWPGGSRAMRADAKAYTRGKHTYRHRAKEILDIMEIGQ